MSLKTPIATSTDTRGCSTPGADTLGSDSGGGQSRSLYIHLAPMEGVVDPIMRDFLTRIGGIDRCVTEFVRVTQQRLPAKVFYRLAPELNQGGKTAAGTPVYLQLLGSDPAILAANAEYAAALGAPGIDLNFGCPAKTVNRHRGGSVLLQEPELLFQIVQAVRQAVPGHIPVTAKMRLGYEDTALALENAQALAAAGATQICVHARTKADGYRPPAHWHWITRIRKAVKVPVVANGDMFSLADIQRCQAVTGCGQVMLGRGLLRCPDLAAQAVRALRDPAHAEVALSWPELVEYLIAYLAACRAYMADRFVPGRVKQWLAFLRHQYPQAQQLFQRLKTAPDVQAIDDLLCAERHAWADHEGRMPQVAHPYTVNPVR